MVSPSPWLCCKWELQDGLPGRVVSGEGNLLLHEFSVRFGEKARWTDIRRALFKHQTIIFREAVAAAVYFIAEGASTLSEFRDFLELSYGELEDLNLQAKDQRREARCRPM